MKSLKFTHDQASKIPDHGEFVTIRYQDDKEVLVNDVIQLIDKVDPDKPQLWKVKTTATVLSSHELRVGDLSNQQIEAVGYANIDDLIATLSEYHQTVVSKLSVVKFITLSINRDVETGDVINTSKALTKVQLFTDGGSRGNPGPSALGYVVVDATEDSVLISKGLYLGVTTNNQAEYLALKYGLEAVQRMSVRHVECYLDSMLVVNQMKGIFKIKNRDLWPVHQAIRDLVEWFEIITFTHVPRERNKLADAEVNRALDTALGIAPKTPSEG
ncbi:MAG TPA: ribonuclease HI family protein [Candidatus Limnocylindrales bacterium]|nr:ribonuclease HI family protein [Candidatus Limnocylindrales bacterium]